MKRLICLLLMIAICLAATGCRQNTAPIKSPVTFYYSRGEFDHGSSDSVIQGETRDSVGYEGDLIGLINLYLQGPVSEDLKSVFPAGTKVKNLWLEEDLAFLSVTDQLSLAKGIDLTVACGCLAKTVMELTGISSVKIQAQTVKLANNDYILMNKDNILLLDSTEIHP